MPMGDALSAVGGAILCVTVACLIKFSVGDLSSLYLRDVEVTVVFTRC
jgi:hypothetical protein